MRELSVIHFIIFRNYSTKTLIWVAKISWHKQFNSGNRLTQDSVNAKFKKCHVCLTISCSLKHIGKYRNIHFFYIKFLIKLIYQFIYLTNYQDLLYYILLFNILWTKYKRSINVYMWLPSVKKCNTHYVTNEIRGGKEILKVNINSQQSVHK